MGMDNLTRQLNPGISALTDQVRGLVSLPVGIAQQAMSVPMGIANELAAPIVNAPQQYPNLTKAVGGLARLGAGLGGDPLAASKIDYYNALGQQSRFKQVQAEKLGAAFSLLQQQIPGFDPNDPNHFRAALPIIGQVAGVEAMQDFADQFNPLQRAEALNKLRDDFVNENEEFAVVESAYKVITESLNKEVGATVMLTQFAKLIDPGSVVRNEEMKVLKEAGGAWGRLRQKILDWSDSEGQGRDELIASLRQEAANIFNNAAEKTQDRTGALRAFAVDDYGYTTEDFDKKFAAGYADALPIATGTAGDLDRYIMVDESEVPEHLRYPASDLNKLNRPMYLRERATGQYVLRDRVFNDPRFPQRIRFTPINRGQQ